MAKVFLHVRSGISYQGLSAAPSDPSNGDVYYNTVSNNFQQYINGSWQVVGNMTSLTGDVTGTGPGATATTIANNVVTNAKSAQMATNTIKGNNTGGTANASDLTVSQVNTMLGDVTTLAAVGSSPSNNGASISGNTLTLQPADGTHPGVITSGTQTIGGAKTFSGAISASNLSGTNTGDVTITDTSTIDLTLTGQSLTADIVAGSITNTHINSSAAIAYSKLAALTSTNILVGNGSNVATSVPVSGDLTLANTGAFTIAAGAVTATKLSTVTDGVTLDQSGAGSTLEVKSGGISNTQVNASAAIAVSKLAALTASKAVVSDGSGFISASTTTSTQVGYLSTTTSDVQTQINTKATKSTGDIDETSFSLANNQAAAANVTGLAFANGTVRSFQALVSVFINATSSLYEVFTLRGIQKGASWDMSSTANGDSSLVVFSITTAGQVQYTSGNYTGFSAGTVKFRATTTSV